MLAFFCFFFLSGFCSLLYQVVWTRMAMANFGVTSALVSIVLSIFMAGLALGSWAGGKLAHRLEARGPAFFVRLYGAVELVIGVSGVAVVPLLGWVRATLNSQQTAWGSANYYFASGLGIALVLLPFCTCMGATLPIAMAALAANRAESPRSFSFLYLANVLGAMAGALASACRSACKRSPPYARPRP